MAQFHVPKVNVHCAGESGLTTSGSEDCLEEGNGFEHVKSPSKDTALGLTGIPKAVVKSGESYSVLQMVVVLYPNKMLFRGSNTVGLDRPSDCAQNLACTGEVLKTGLKINYNSLMCGSCNVRPHISELSHRY